MTWSQILGVIAAMGVASIVQSLSGFGFALMAVPLMSLSIDVRHAVVVSTIVATGTTCVHAWKERAHADEVLARRLVIASFAGMPVGLVAFIFVSQAVMKIALGIVVVVITVLLHRGVSIPADSRRHEWILGGASGVLATSLSTNGPPLVFLLQARGMTPAAFRGTISRVFAVVNFVTLGMFLAAGKVHEDSLILVLWVIPVVVVCTWVGYRLRPVLDAARFRAMVLALLMLTGISAIVTAVL